MDSLYQAPMIMFNTYTTQFNFSHHNHTTVPGLTTYLDAKGASKRIFPSAKNKSNPRLLIHTWKTVWESKTVSHSRQDW